MLEKALIVLHIATLGYWFGSELVINATSRHVCLGRTIPLDERTRLMQLVMNVDQHVRYALVIQFGLGFAIAALFGYIPGGNATAIGFAIFTVLWLLYIEVTHRLLHRPLGKKLASLDRRSRYVLMACLFAIALGLVGGAWDLPYWIRLKLGLFATVMACGVAIRFSVLARFKTWAVMQASGVTDAHNDVVKRTYLISTGILVLLWLIIFAMVAISLYKPV